ncbi:hypothetical protein MLD38_004784 [Melastoma candidum]|uniref:Uncharacterized protein n=1 Tax=Melastoma candidum TaxID=119954 RepID=A0ACB9S6Q7_9MYRT|nr:hypothetical protein MLD38_004784 [Melastoma candidum]
MAPVEQPSWEQNKLLLLFLFLVLLAVPAAALPVAAAEQWPYHSLLKSSCSSTLYPDLCYSAVASSVFASSAAPLSTHKDIILASLNLTIGSAKQNRLSVLDLTRTRSAQLTAREKTALNDCVETIDLTLDELHSTVADLHVYPQRKTLLQHADDLKTLISAAITNQETCLDGFSHDDADRHVRQRLSDGQVHVERMCSNALAMVKSLTDADIAAEKARMARSNRKLREEAVAEDAQWPKWVKAGDRKLLQASSVAANVTVAADGSGDYRTVSAAVADAPLKSEKRYVIRIKAGVYEENVEVPKKKTNIMFLGEGRGKTVVTSNRSVVNGSTTFKSATVAVVEVEQFTAGQFIGGGSWLGSTGFPFTLGMF